MKVFAHLAAAAAGLVLANSAVAAPVPAEKSKPIDLVLCLDVSGSMNGLIDSAKLKLWDVVNELARAKPTPNLRVALYSYGASHYPADKGWVKKELDLTTDLDEVYAKLNALRTGGGDEYVARVTKTALDEQKWDEGQDSLRVIFVCGNEPADQDKQVSLADASALAKKKNVIVNTIYCYPANNPEAKGWRDFATMSGGAYANIDQNQAAKDIALSIKTPVDEKLLKLNEQLNTTYVTYGAKGAEGAAQQKAQDSAATANAPAAGLARAETKANALYKCSTWDLIDRMKDDPKFDLKTIKEEELCEDLRKMKAEERMPYLKKKGEERAKIQKEINDLSAERARFVAEERKKQPKSDTDKALDEALKGIIREQSKAKGFEIAAPEKK
jgi:hypothetical protein